MGSVGGNVSLKQVIEVFSERDVERKTLFLDNIDQRFGYFVRNIFFFKNSPGLDALLEQLQRGLSKVLVYYPCFAGRLRVNEKQKLEIDSNNQGVLLAGATCQDLSISEITDSDFDTFFLEPSDSIRSLDDLPLVTIQVTHLEKLNEYMITVSLHHTLGEATSAIYFLINLTTQCRWEEMLFIPTFDRTPFKARDPPQPRFDHEEFGAQGADSRYTASSDSVLKAVSLRKKIATVSSRQRKEYHLSTERLTGIKQSALTDKSLNRCSTFDALASLVWRAHVGAEGLTGEVRMRFVMDTRSIVNPPLGREFCGNAVYTVCVVAQVSELLTEPLSSTVRRIQAAKGRVTEEYLKSGIDFLELHPNFWYHPECHTVINSWPKAMSYSTDLDFGWGKPTRVEFPMHPGNKAIIFFPFSDTGLDVSVSLEPRQIAAFEKAFLE